MREDGTFVQAAFGRHLMFSLNLRQDVDLIPGNYIIMIDPIWDISTHLHEDFKNILIDIYAPLQV